VVVSFAVLSSCGESAQDPVATESVVTPAMTSPPGSTTSSEGPVKIVGTYEAVAFYPACANEALEHEGVTWYPIVHVGYDPLDPRLQTYVDDVLAVVREEAPLATEHGFVRVAPPGPGDDVGTLFVWADGVARWVSDSGDLDVWMIDDVIEYNWVC
jgi:hypothetical protein